MSSDLPPTMDAQAAARWAQQPHAASPWLHEEVGRRMQERLQWIRMQPRTWLDWAPLSGGLQAHAAVAQAYPDASCWVAEPADARQQAAEQALHRPWWQVARWRKSPPRFGMPPDGTADMVWANMALHMAADPKSLLLTWHRLLAADGFLMFSCLGPDTLGRLRDLYRSLGWPQPAHEFTDMHDWGDMLVQAGFAEPVMDMERLSLTFDTPERMLAELRTLGRNLHPQRFQGLRGRAWKARLLDALATQSAHQVRGAPLALEFEIIYGHALKPQASLAIQAETVLSLDEMRRMLKRAPTGAGPTR